MNIFNLPPIGIVTPMSDVKLPLKNPPIVEAVLDIDCDMPPAFDLIEVEESAHEAFHTSFPKVRVRLMQEHLIQAKPHEEPLHSFRHARHSLQFLSLDEKQLVQVRANGFSFNRLAPYSSLTDYLPEIEQAWQVFVQVAQPVALRQINLRYINRILVPADGVNAIILDDYLKIGPGIVDHENMLMTGFLNQYSAVDRNTRFQTNVVLTGQAVENDGYPLIFDITVSAAVSPGVEPADWPNIVQVIQSLRGLKNRVFENTLTERCLNLFR